MFKHKTVGKWDVAELKGKIFGLNQKKSPWKSIVGYLFMACVIWAWTVPLHLKLSPLPET